MKTSSVSFCLIFLMAFIDKLQSCQDIYEGKKFPNSDIYLKIVRYEKVSYQILRDCNILQTVSLENFFPSKNIELLPNGNIKLTDGNSEITFSLLENKYNLVLIHVSRSNIPVMTQPKDCVDLSIGKVHWFGGPEDLYQYWPMEKYIFKNFSYVVKEDRHAGIAERYWLNSKGVFFYIEKKTQLFIDQNAPGYENQLCFSAVASLPYNRRVKTTKFDYYVGISKNLKEAHLQAVKYFLDFPKSYPDERMVKYPIWSTWALYKAEIDDARVRELADKILFHRFNNSQLEIDDDWEDCYGALTFRKKKFPNTLQLSRDLKANGFRVHLWVHPFINKNCTIIYKEALDKGYVVLNHENNPDTKWWNSKLNDAAHIDFTKSAARIWFTNRLKRLQSEEGIDNFKFDAGETSWIPSDPILQGDPYDSPHSLTRAYIQTVSVFGGSIEVRTGQATQDFPLFVRMIDKDSNWGWNNGLITLIPTLMQMNLNGYPYVLPDMIGGNGYNNTPPTKELFIRWLQANVFMPCLQFSYVPWNFDEETIEISRKFTALHTEYSEKIMERFRLAARTGEPVNPPIWWVDPNDKIAWQIHDQFMLGDDIIAAPIVQEGRTSRDIYLPNGHWLDGNTQELHFGPKWIMDYHAPLNVLPYFLKASVGPRR